MGLTAAGCGAVSSDGRESEVSCCRSAVSHDLLGGAVVEDEAGPLVELSGDPGEDPLVVLTQVGVFREVLAQQPVGVLVRAALPGRVGVGEEDLGAGRRADLLMPEQLAPHDPMSGTCASGPARSPER